MRIGFILGVLALTALVFFVAIQSLAIGPARTAEQAELDLAADREKLSNTLEENSGLRTALAEQEEKNSTLQSTLSDARAEKEQLEADFAALKAAAAQVSQEEADNRALSESIDALQTELSAAKRASETLQKEAQAKSDEITAAWAQITALQSSIAEAKRSRELSEAKIAELKRSRELSEAKVAKLNRNRELSDAKIAELSAELDARADTESSDPNPQLIAERDLALAELVSLKKEIEDQGGFTSEVTELIAAMRQRISNLQTELVDREAKIAALNASPKVTPISSAAVCQSQTDALAGAITFETGGTAISPESMGLLEELTGIVADCVQEDVLLEIEGHTDSAGGDASNLLLSNARANAVLAFLAERGVPVGSMRAVGFGSSDPVADNASAEGRSQNQRVVFDWKMK